MKNYDLVMCVTQHFGTTYWMLLVGIVVSSALGYWAGYVHCSRNESDDASKLPKEGK